MLQALGDEEEEEEEEGDTVAARALLNRIRGATGTSSGASSSGNNSKAGGSSSGAGGARGRGAGSRPTVASSAATATGIDDDASQQMQTQAQTQQLPVLMLQPDYRVEIVRLRSELNAQKDAFKDLVSPYALYPTYVSCFVQLIFYAYVRVYVYIGNHSCDVRYAAPSPRVRTFAARIRQNEVCACLANLCALLFATTHGICVRVYVYTRPGLPPSTCL